LFVVGICCGRSSRDASFSKRIWREFGAKSWSFSANGDHRNKERSLTQLFTMNISNKVSAGGDDIPWRRDVSASSFSCCFCIIYIIRRNPPQAGIANELCCEKSEKS